MSFDIRDALAGRTYVTTKAPFWVDDAIFYEIEAAVEAHAEAIDNDIRMKAEGELDRLEAERDAQAYTLHLRAISNRSNEDIVSKALSQFPIKRDAFGREDDNTVIKRNRLMRELQLAAHLTKIVSPDGETQVIDDDNRGDIARALLADAPPVSLGVVDQAIAKINNEFKTQQAAHQDTDFLSKR
jgi:hypothetical protein